MLESFTLLQLVVSARAGAMEIQICVVELSLHIGYSASGILNQCCTCT